MRKHYHKHSQSNNTNLGGGIFLIGLALLFMTGWWWPGIMFVIGASIIGNTVAEGDDWRNATGAFWVIGIGIIFGFSSIFGGFDWGSLWILMLFGIGALMIFGKYNAMACDDNPAGRKRKNSEKRKNDDYANYDDDDDIL